MACSRWSQACRRHKSAPTASAAMGRALLGTLLMGSFKEEGERTQVTFKGNGILGAMQVHTCFSSETQSKFPFDLDRAHRRSAASACKQQQQQQC